MVNNPLIRPAISWGKRGRSRWVGPLNSYDWYQATVVGFLLDIVIPWSRHLRRNFSRFHRQKMEKKLEFLKDLLSMSLGGGSFLTRPMLCWKRVER